MVRGLDVFREHFKDFGEAYVLIGGTACHEVFADEGLDFRATKDLDIVLILEVIDPKFIEAFKDFIEKGKYQVSQRSSDGKPILYRFGEPKDLSFPAKLELSCRRPDQINLGEDQKYTPIPVDESIQSLSAVLLDDAYYSWVLAHRNTVNGVSVASVTALIPLKAHAWLNLTKRKEQGEKVDSRDIDKHRNDVFRLAGTLLDEPGPALPESILADLKTFLEKFPEDSPQWTAILASIKTTLGSVGSDELLGALNTYFRIK